ncbi:MAG: flagellar hook-basal body complex protein FliE [Desulfobacteraceae bacterium]|nr:MAG: flagellar hook-basal body complex protein FliE [Desulfobacteraceae bacterium]
MKVEQNGPSLEWPEWQVSEGKAQKTDFLKTLSSFYNQVSQDLNTADQVSAEFAAGKKFDLHEVMIVTEKAGISFRLLLQIRNKLLEAYQEVMRMQF